MTRRATRRSYRNRLGEAEHLDQPANGVEGAKEGAMAGEFHSIVEGKMRSRGRDSFGSGQPGASRGQRSHQGIDVATVSGQKILSPIEGDVIREAFPYPDDPSMRGILIRGTGAHAGWEIKLFYVVGYFSGRVKPGGQIGQAQDLTKSTLE